MASKSYEKMVEEIGNMSVLELADLVKLLEETFGVSAAMPAMAAAPAAAPAAAAQEEKSEYKVTLQDAGSEKIKAIKAVKSLIAGLSLSEAKDKVEGAPSVLAESASKQDAEKIKKELEAVGAKVVLS
ncbi:50S ribosomal protein L7/L12 [Candidatus Dependentiae bacterium Noda2021]|nr:50S ribosomal protein L7/L12 [Candidatus Dependentiae bacterium Noda2021]